MLKISPYNPYGLEKRIEEMKEEQQNHYKMSNWGTKKKKRFEELLKKGLNKEEAFNIVENKKGKYPA